MSGGLSSFAEAATLSLPKLCGLRVAGSTVERTTEAAGRDVGDRLASGETFGRSRAWGWHKDAEGKTAPRCRSTRRASGSKARVVPPPRGG